MTPYRQFSKFPEWKNAALRGAFYATVAGMLVFGSGCSSSEPRTQTVEVTEATQGVITTVQEQKNGEYKVLDEQLVASKDDSRLIVKKLDGSIDTMTVDMAKKLVTEKETVSYNTNNAGLGNIVWWGMMGYMMGRSFSSPIPQTIYANPQTYQKSTQQAGTLKSTARTTTTKVPKGSSSGYFNNSSKSSSGS